jgi:hypothetical protein
MHSVVLSYNGDELMRCIKAPYKVHCIYASGSCTSTDLVLSPHALCRVTVLQIAELEVAGTGTATTITVLAGYTPDAARKLRKLVV